MSKMGHKNDSQARVKSKYMRQLDPLIKYFFAVSFGACWLMGVHAILVYKISLIPMLMHGRTTWFKRVKKMHTRYNEGDLSDSETSFYKRLSLLQTVILGWGLGGLTFLLFYYAVYVVPNFKVWE